MPELRLVVLALQDRLGYGPTFEAAMTSLFGAGDRGGGRGRVASPAPAAGGGRAGDVAGAARPCRLPYSRSSTRRRAIWPTISG